jgi:hypothetical protein
MTLQIFEEILRKECNRLFADLKSGERARRLQKDRAAVHTLTDILRKSRDIGELELFSSCVKTFGHVLEASAAGYAAQAGAEVIAEKNIGAVKIDIVFIWKNTVYSLESKANIELDVGKSENTFTELRRKCIIISQALKCDVRGYSCVSKILVWTKATAHDAAKKAKYPITEDDLMGYVDFFGVFGAVVHPSDFEATLQKVFHEEVEAYF